MPPLNIINLLVNLRRYWGFATYSIRLPTGPALLMTGGIIGIITWVMLDRAYDIVCNNEVYTLDQKCRYQIYDYIVVGAGTAGMVVATRLANASKNISVLLLEAGGEPSIYNEVPVADFFLTNQPPNTWLYYSTPQHNSSQNLDGKRTLTVRGKMLGGTSSNNFMQYTRGNREDFERWATDVADNQWNYEHVLPYFKKSENYDGAYAHQPYSKNFHGKGGLLNVDTHDFMPGVEDFLAAGMEKGYPVGDSNGDHNGEVFSKLDVTTQDGFRESTYRAFYRDSWKSANLCIKKYAQVVKINFRGSRATGVTYLRHGIVGMVNAIREVIVSAGVFGSPKLLMLSGVGPREHLQDHWIPVVKDLPVGRNLQDHAFVLGGPFLIGPALSPNRDINPKRLMEFTLNGTGPMAAPAGFSGHAFLQSPVADPPYPDIHIMQLSVSLYNEFPRHMNRFVGLRKDVMEAWLDPFYQRNVDARFVFIMIGRPKSIGAVTLNSVNPFDTINVNPRYLSHPDDMEALLFGLKTVVDLFENTTALNTRLLVKPVPGCEVEDFKSDAYYRCVIRRMSGSFHNHVGTCALGKVVDSRLKVIGLQALRVIDASVIPRTPNANVMAATIMIGEKAADLIISDMRNYEHQKHSRKKQG